MSIVKPKIQTSVHYCEETKKGMLKHYNDFFNLGQPNDQAKDLTNTFPTKDANDNPLSCDYGYCLYKDYQTVTIQELPERAPTGQLPRSVQVVLENDLVDKIKPGDRVEVSGVYKCVPNKANGSTSGAFRTVLVATGIQNINAEQEKP
mmetsp:Transcript_47771/g.35020  ORF Transcript_47771/g.35020 Transcript_47771/m.35020 type:complete len:148 (-) Transcript_47771:384-827(-)